jgi:voltage-gated potassium channel
MPHRRFRRPRLPHRVWFAIAVPFILLSIGTLGYKLTGGTEWSWFDCTYMSAITLTTVGYGETHELTQNGRIFTVFFLFGGVFLLAFTATEAVRQIVSGEFQQIIGKLNMRHTLEEMKDHVIVCGLGRMGKLVCQEFERQEKPYVVIEREQKILEQIEYKHGVPLIGDATVDDILKRAGVERATSLVTVLPSDADNLYIVLSARLINPKLKVISRAEEEAAEAKLRRVGANHIVSPYIIGGHRVAQAILRPTVMNFLDQATRHGVDDYIIEEIRMAKNSPLCGKTLRESDLGNRFDVVVISLKKPNGETVYNPQGPTVVEPDSVLVVVGHRQQLTVLEKVAGG